MAEDRTARDIMTAPVITAAEDMYLTELMKIMASNHITGLPVVDDNGNLLGMISWRLVMNVASVDKLTHMRVFEVIDKKIEMYSRTCTPDTPVEDIFKRFTCYPINRIVVLDDGGPNSKVLGIICRCDIISEMDKNYDSK